MTSPQTHKIHEQYEGTPLWRALEAALDDLMASREVTIATAPRYVLGYLCQELAAKWVVTGAALTRDREPLGRAPGTRAPGTRPPTDPASRGRPHATEE
jgi:hypothetical protein